MPMPTLLMIDEDTNKIRRLQEENERLRQRLSEMVKIDSILDVNAGPTPQQPPLMDDFYIIAQYALILSMYTLFRSFIESTHLLLFSYCYRESPVVDNPKTLRNLIRNIGGGSSPILSRKSTGSIKKHSEADTNITKRANTKGRITSLSKSEAVAKRSTSCDSRLTRKRDSSVDTGRESKAKDKLDGSYILLSQVSWIQSSLNLTVIAEKR